MDLKIDSINVPLPNEKPFCAQICSVLNNNKAVQYMKDNILVKLKSRIKEVILPLTEKDFLLERQFKVANGEVSQLDEAEIEQFLDDVKKFNLNKYFAEILEETFKTEEAQGYCKNNEVSIVISIIGTWFRSYLKIFNKGIGKSIERQP